LVEVYVVFNRVARIVEIVYSNEQSARIYVEDRITESGGGDHRKYKEKDFSIGRWEVQEG
jgi:hypothetical protein